MGPTWVLSAPDGPHVGPMHLAIRGCLHRRAILSRPQCVKAYSRRIFLECFVCTFIGRRTYTKDGNCKLHGAHIQSVYRNIHYTFLYILWYNITSMYTKGTERNDCSSTKEHSGWEPIFIVIGISLNRIQMTITIILATDHQVRCILLAQVVIFDKGIGFLCWFFALNIFCEEYLQQSLCLIM